MFVAGAEEARSILRSQWALSGSELPFAEWCRLLSQTSAGATSSSGPSPVDLLSLLQGQQQMLSLLISGSASATSPAAGAAAVAEAAPDAGEAEEEAAVVAANASFVPVEAMEVNTNMFNICNDCNMQCYFKKTNQAGWWTHPHPQIRCVNVLRPRNKAYFCVSSFGRDA